MEQIKEDYVSFETAKLLKENGFEPPHDYRKCMPIMYTDKGEIKWGVWSDDWYPRITLQMAMKWLREVHHIFIDIDYDSHEFGDKPYFTLITNMDTCSYYSGKHLPVNRATYEEMAEAAIKYCLENLI